MGVTAYFFAFDPRAYPTPPTIETLRERGDLDDELSVLPNAASRLQELTSILGSNKRWNDNLAGDYAWFCARKHVPADLRTALDHWLSHLFWDAGDVGDACPCAREPTVVADHEVVYDRALLEHILSLACPLDPLQAALAVEFDGEPPKTERLPQTWIYDFDGFTWLVSEWQRLFERALAAGPGWSLLRWVWH